MHLGIRISEFGHHVSTNDDAPCAVCQVQSTSTLMVSAKRSCPSGWSMEYNGIAGASDEFAFEYICIDENPEYFEVTRSHNDNGLTLHPVQDVGANRVPHTLKISTYHVLFVLTKSTEYTNEK